MRTVTWPGPADSLRLTIRAALAHSGITQAELARRLHLSPKHVCQVLKGRAGLSIDMADRMLAACDWRLVVGAHPTTEEVDRG